jgi:hypothetical protein
MKKNIKSKFDFSYEEDSNDYFDKDIYNSSLPCPDDKESELSLFAIREEQEFREALNFNP